MTTDDKPKSRLPDGRVNPEYTAWRKAQKAVETVESPEPEPVATPITGEISLMTLRVVKAAKNPRYVYADLNGVKVPVAIKKGMARRFMKKKIPVEVRTVGDKTTYHHAR